MIVNKHTFVFALYILVCFIYFIWPCKAKKKYSCDLPKNLRSVGEPETLFSWPYFQECRLPLHNARPTLKNFCIPIPDSIKKRRVSGICYF